MFYKATNFLRSQSFYRKYGPNLPISLTHRVSIRPKATHLGDLMRLWVRFKQRLCITTEFFGSTDTNRTAQKLHCLYA
jgi:hypothetical protein